MIRETQAFVQVVNFLMLAWSWSWFVMIFYLLSYLIFILVKKFNYLCWCWWCCRCRWLLVSLTAPTKPGAWASRCHLDVYVLVLQQEIWIGNVEILFFTASGIKTSSRCLHCRFTARNLNRKCWRFFYWQLWRPVIKMSSLRSLSYLELFVVVAFVVFSPLYCSIMQHFVCVV